MRSMSTANDLIASGSDLHRRSANHATFRSRVGAETGNTKMNPMNTDR